MWSKEQITELIQRFEAGVLPRTEWTHEAHLVMGVAYVLEYPFEKAMERAREHIIAHNEAVGTRNTQEEGYHETITRFWLIMIKMFLVRTTTTSVDEAVNLFLQSRNADKSVPLNYYSKQELFSTWARTEWVPPLNPIVPIIDNAFQL